MSSEHDQLETVAYDTPLRLMLPPAIDDRFVETRGKRRLAKLFGQYIPAERFGTARAMHCRPHGACSAR